MTVRLVAIFWSCLLSTFALVADLHAADTLPQVELSVKPLDLSEPPTTEEIMAAGQLGGQLYPTHELTDIQREKAVNASFGAAIQEWNKHEYKEAVKLFRKHMKEYPDSPWAAEAILHIGCDAQYTGRYSEAESSFFSILENLKGKGYEGAKKLVRKAKLRLAVLKVAENNFDEAGRLFTDLHQSSDNWRDRTYASHWIQRLSRYKAEKLAMLNCGALALARVLAKEGKEKEAREVAAMLPTSFSGHSMQDLMAIAAGYGYEFVGLRVAEDELDRLPLPAIVQLNPRNGGDSGHYWTLEKVQGGEVELFDPQAGRRFKQSVAEFSREWDGAVLALLAGGAPSNVATKMTQAETEARYGGCCGVPRPPEDLGAPCENKGPGSPSCCSSGAPTWSVNMVNMNLFVTDTPLWYDPPIGPPVKITLSYNAQSSIAYNQPFGNKWQFNYNSYLVVDTGGQVVVFMPDGRNDTYSPDGSGGYIKPFGEFNTLTKLAENHFTLRLPDDTVYEYDIPAGTSSLQPFLVKITDPYGQSLTFGYNADVKLATITDALGRVTTIEYTGSLITVTDPFGRHALFEIDASDNLTKITDMGSYWTALTYDQDVYLTSLGNSQGTWGFYFEPADGIDNGTIPYPQPGGTMWENYRITVTNPLGGKEEYHYDGDYGRSWYVSPRYYQPYISSSANNYAADVPKKRYDFLIFGGKGYIAEITNPDDGITSFTYDSATGKKGSVKDSHNHTVSYTYNAVGRVASTTDAKLKTTTMTYAPNNVDLTAITIPGLGTQSMGYNSYHNVTSVTNRLGKTTSYAYNAFGQLTSITDPLTHVTTLNYYDAAHPTKYRLKEVIRDGKVLHSYTYDPIGRIFTHTDPTGLTLVYEYDDLNQVTAITYPDGKQETFAYSPCCPRLLDSSTDRGGRTTTYTYDDMRRLTLVRQPDQSLIRYEYDADGNLSKLFDPNNKATTLAYDSMNRLIKKTYADGKYETYGYDGEGLLTAKANARDTAAGRTTATYSYDANHNLTGITYTDGTPNVGYDYDYFNRVTSRTDGIGAWAFGYDAESRLLTVDGPWENDTVTYGYDDNGRRTSVQPQDGETVTYGFDALDRLMTVTPGTRSFVYDYPVNSSTPLPATLTRPNGSFTTYQYDPMKRLTEIANKNSAQELILSDAFTYNARDMRDTETVTNGAPITNFTANLTTYSYNNVNQLLSTTSPAQAFAYDADGNMTTGYTPEGYQFTATYDGENRLKTIDYTDGASVAHHADYSYSGNGLLAKQAVDGIEARFVRGGYSLLQERDSSNGISRSYVWDSNASGGIGGLLELGQGGQRYIYLFDGRSNVRTLLNENQAVIATYTYDEFGNLMARTGMLAQPFQFSTKEYNENTGLSYYGHRFYSPVIGRWIAKDPIGFNGGDLNLYGFIKNNTINSFDPYGLADTNFSFNFDIGGGISHLIFGGGAVDATITELNSGKKCTYTIYCGGVGVGLPEFNITSRPIGFSTSECKECSDFYGYGYIGGISVMVGAGFNTGGGIKIPNGPFIPGNIGPDQPLEYGGFHVGVSHSLCYFHSNN